MKHFVITALFSSMLLAKSYAGVYDQYELGENAILHFHKGQTWLEIKQCNAAIKEFRIALRLNPQAGLSAVLNNNLGLAYQQCQQYALAQQAFLQASNSQPQFEPYYRNWIGATRLSGDLPRVITEMQKRVTQNPKDPLPWYTLGLAYEAQGNEKAGQKAFEEYVKLAQPNPLVDLTKRKLQHYGSRLSAIQ